jgi:hypothetical protein
MDRLPAPSSSGNPCFSQENWHQFGATLTNSGNVDQAFRHEEIFDGIRSSYNKYFDRDGFHFPLSAQRMFFAKDVLKEMWLFALSESPVELHYHDNDKNNYVVRKVNTKVSLIKQSPATWELSWSNGLQSVPVEDTVLYEFDVPTFQTGLKSALQSSNSSPNVNTLHSLLSNNQETLVQLAANISMGPSGSFPANLVKLAKCYIWQVQSNYKKEDEDPIHFPIFMHPRIRRSEVLDAFLTSGALPQDDKQKCSLAWEFCEVQGLDSWRAAHHLAYIFKDVQHADFTFVDSKDTEGQQRDLKIFILKSYVAFWLITLVVVRSVLHISVLLMSLARVHIV